MSLLYIISIIAIVIQICCLTVSVGKKKINGEKINDEKINVYFSDFLIFYSCWPLLCCRIGGRIYSHCKKSHNYHCFVCDHRLSTIYVP